MTVHYTGRWLKQVTVGVPIMIGLLAKDVSSIWRRKSHKKSDPPETWAISIFLPISHSLTHPSTFTSSSCHPGYISSLAPHQLPAPSPTPPPLHHHPRYVSSPAAHQLPNWNWNWNGTHRYGSDSHSLQLMSIVVPHPQHDHETYPATWQTYPGPCH